MEDPMRTRLARLLAAALAAALLLAGCASGTAEIGSDPNDPDQREHVAWWATVVGSTPLYGRSAEFTTTNPDTDFTTASVRGAAGAKAGQAIAARLDAGNPPDTFQAAAGAALTD